MNEGQRKFADAWVRTHNVTTALTEGGYDFDPKHPMNRAKRLFRLLRTYIEYLESRQLARTHLTIESVQLQLVKLGFSNILNYYTKDAQGNTRAKRIDELTHDEAAAIREINHIMVKTGKKNPDGTDEEVAVIGEIKLHEARGPLQDLLKSLGGMPTGRPGETPPAAPVDSPFNRLPPSEAVKLDKALKDALAALNKQRDASAITVSRGADGVHQGDEPGQARTRALPPPATKADT